MKQFIQSKPGMISILAFVILMSFMVHRVLVRRHERQVSVGASSTPSVAAPAKSSVPTAPEACVPNTTAARDDSSLPENVAYLERYYELDRKMREDHDRQGNPLTRRQTAATPSSAGRTSEVLDPAPTPAPVTPVRGSLRLHGRSAAADAGSRPAPASVIDNVTRKLEPVAHMPAAEAPAAPPAVPSQRRIVAKRFNPFGRVIKCELVFTIDSTNEQSPLVGVVMEPVYNNGALIIPAGAEFHGVARPDRLRDRIFSGPEWVLVFPREHGRPNGRQLNVKGVALDRIEPDANGMTWGITDGSYGLEGRVIRTMADAEIKRFVATFLAAGTVALEARQSDRTGQESYRNTPQNAVLQGLAANFQKIADDITAEIAQHGVFIRVPAGHQFYFYPMQIIDPDAADVSSDIATVK